MKTERASAWGRGAMLLTALVLPAVVLAWNAYTRRWLSDDGFINLRVVQQLLAGNGFVFNAGERSEAVTSPGWVAVLWLAGALDARLEDAAWLLGLGFSVLGLGLSGVAALTSHPPGERRALWFFPLGLLCFACLPPAWDFATSGLENGLGLAFLGTSFWLVALATRPGVTRAAPPYAAAFVLSWAPLLRPDYELLAAPLLAFLCLRASGTRRRLGLIAVGVSAGAAFEVFRMGYFASLFPNTALAKQALEARWDQGLRYLWNSVGLYWLLVPLSGVVLLLGSRHRARDLAAGPSHAAGLPALPFWLFGAGVLHLSYVVGMGGDFMHARLLLPGFFALFSAVPLLGVSLGLARSQRWLQAVVGACLYGWCAVCAARLRVASKNEFGIGDERGWYVAMSEVRNPTRIEDYAQFYFYRDAARKRRQLKKHCESPARTAADPAAACPRVLLTGKEDGVLEDAPPSAMLELWDASTPPGVAAVVASRPLGIAAAVLGIHVHVVDYFGLADPVAARLTLTQRRRPGHEKSFDTPWQAARYAAPGSTSDGRVLAARHALSCGALAELVRATREPLTLRRFLDNLRLAPRLTWLRIPRDHWQAEQAFCPVPDSVSHRDATSLPARAGSEPPAGAGREPPAGAGREPPAGAGRDRSLPQRGGGQGPGPCGTAAFVASAGLLRRSSRPGPRPTNFLWTRLNWA